MTSRPDPDLDGFLALLATRRAPRTVEAYRRDLTQLAAWRDGPVGGTTTEELERWLAEQRANGIAASTVARRVAAVRAFFRHQMLLGSREDNPAAALQLPRRIRSLPKTLSPGEAERLIDAANGTTPRAMRDRALVELMYGAGLRVCEATGLHRRSVDLDARIVRALGKGSRSGSCRSAGRRPKLCAATSRWAGRTSTGATVPSSSSTRAAGRSRVPARS